LEVLRRVTDDEPARPSALAPGIDRDLDTICLRCLQKEPAKRYPSALAFAEDIDHWLRGEPISARPAGTVERIWKWARRRPAVASLWIIAVLALSGGIVAGALYTVRLEHERRAALHRVAHQHVQTALGLTESGEWHRALLYLAEAVEMGTGDAARDRINRLRFECLVRQSPKLTGLWFFPEDAPQHAEFSASGNAVLFLHARSARLFDVVTGHALGPPLSHPADMITGAVDAAGSRVVCGTRDGMWTLWDPRAGIVIARGEGQLCGLPPPGVSRPAGIFAGARFVVSHGTGAQCFNADDGQLVGKPVWRHAPVLWAALTPDGNTVLSLTDDNILRPGSDRAGAASPDSLIARFFHPEDAEVLPCPPGAQLMYFHTGYRMDALQADRGWFAIVHWPEFVPKQTDRFLEPLFAQSFRKGLNWVLLARNPRGVSLVDGWAPVTPRLLEHGAAGVAGAFDTAGLTALTLASDGSAQHWDLVADRPLGPRLRLIGVPSGVALSGDGKSTVLRSGAPAVWLWRQSPPSMATDVPPPGPPDSRSADGRLLFRIGSDASIVLHDAASGTVLFAPLRHPAPVAEAAFSPDNALLATRAGDHIRVWETATGQPVMPPSLHPGAAEIRWSANSAALYTRGTDGWQMLDMSPGTRSLTDMRALARLLAAGRLVSGNEGGIVPLTAEELRAAREQAIARPQ
jgi:WD40 repeat protein